MPFEASTCPVELWSSRMVIRALQLSGSLRTSAGGRALRCALRTLGVRLFGLLASSARLFGSCCGGGPKVLELLGRIYACVLRALQAGAVCGARRSLRCLLLLGHTLHR